MFGQPAGRHRAALAHALRAVGSAYANADAHATPGAPPRPPTMSCACTGARVPRRNPPSMPPCLQASAPSTLMRPHPLPPFLPPSQSYNGKVIAVPATRVVAFFVHEGWPLYGRPHMADAK